jgi:hypothetical protein
MQLLREFAKSGGNPGVETSGPEVRIFVPKWLPGPDENANYVLPIPLQTTQRPSLRIRKRDRDRAERIRLAGGPEPTLRERAVAVPIAFAPA